MTRPSSILFKDGEFSAADLENPPLLTINAPIGLGFRDQPGDIVNRSVGQNPNGETNITDGAVGLQVPNGETLAIVGGNVLLNDGNLTTKGGQIEIGSVQGAGKIGFTEIDTKFALDYSSINSFGDITLQDTAVVDVTAGGGGSINVASKNLSLDNSSSLNAGIAVNSNLSKAQAGNIIINATDAITINNSGLIRNDVNFGAVGDAGNIEINTGSFTANNSAQITSQVVGKGNSGDININAQGKVFFDGRDETDSYPSAIFTNIEPDGEGNGGNINIQAESLEIKNRAQLLSNVSGIGNAGDINIQVANEVNLTNSIMISEVTAPDKNGEGGRGDGGDINITTGSLFVRDGSALLADTENIGNAGNINIEARDQIVLEGEWPGAQTGSLEQGNIVSSQITATVDGEANPDVEGNAGNINISTPSLIVKDSGFIRNRTFAQGNAGNLTIDVQRLDLNEGRIDASTFGAGKGGNLTITASEIKLSGSGGEFPTSIFVKAIDGTGDAGNLTITTDKITIRDQSSIDVGNFVRLFPRTTPPDLSPGQGAAGILKINANSIEVNNAIISADNANGTGGELEINTNSLTLENGGSISAESTSDTGTGGKISLNVDGILEMRDNSLISGRAIEGAKGGNLKIDAQFIVAYPDGNSDILANAQQRQGGNITIAAESLFGIQKRSLDDSTNDINASSNFDLDGTVNINTSKIDPLQGAMELPSNVVEAKQTAEQTCSADRDGKATNGLAIAGRGGVTPPPDAPLNSENISSENPAQASIPEPIETAQGKIQPARGIKFTKDGRIILTAYPTNNAGERIPEGKINCGQI